GLDRNDRHSHASRSRTKLNYTVPALRECLVDRQVSQSAPAPAAIDREPGHGLAEVEDGAHRELGSGPSRVAARLGSAGPGRAGSAGSVTVTVSPPPAFGADVI